MPKDDSIRIRVPRAEKRRLVKAAESRGWSLSQLIREGAKLVANMQAAA